MVFKRSNLEQQVPNLPKKVQWCRSCLMSNQRPRIIFDENGICSGCINSKSKRKINWHDREKELHRLLDSHRSKTGNFDVIVPSSGGKDSALVAHMLKYKYNMNPLTVTWSPLEYTDIGKKNFYSLINSGLTNILITPDGQIQKRLSRLCFEELGDAFHTFVMGQISVPFHIAIKFNIKLVFFGENGELEYAGDPEYIDKPFKPHKEWLKQHFKGVTFDELIKFGLKKKKYIQDIKKYIAKKNLWFYQPPPSSLLKKSGIKGKYFFSYFKKWIPQENYYYAVENTGFKANDERSEGTYSRYASLDDKMDGMHYYMRYIKFGLGRCCEDASHEIRDGHITRNEGLNLVKKFDGEFPKKYFQNFLNYLQISEKHFSEVVNSWRSKNIWKKKNNRWVLKEPPV